MLSHHIILRELLFIAIPEEEDVLALKCRGDK
jgi:hypothetical protein